MDHRRVVPAEELWVTVFSLYSREQGLAESVPTQPELNVIMVKMYDCGPVLRQCETS